MTPEAPSIFNKLEIQKIENENSTKIISKPEDILALFLTWILLTSAAPFTFFVAIPNHPYKALIALVLSLCLILLLNKRKIKNICKPLIWILAAQTLFFSTIFAVFHGLLTDEMNADAYITLSIQYVAILITYIYVCSYYSIYKLAKSYVYIILFMSVLGLIAFVLGLLGLIEVATIHQNPDTRTAYNFWITFSNHVFSYGNHLIIRVAGFFDEPGTLAYYIIFALLVARIYGFSSKRTELLLMLLGIPTLSLAYFITIALYVALFYFNFKHLKYLLIVALVLGSLAFYVNLSQDRGPVHSLVYTVTLGRLERNTGNSSEGIIAGDNRSVLFRTANQAFQDAPLIGHGIRYAEDPQGKYRGSYLGANVMAPLAMHGVLGTIFVFLHFIYWSYLIFFRARVRKTLVFAWLIIFITFLQRPDITGYLNYFVIIFLIDATFNRSMRQVSASPYFNNRQE